MSELEYFGDVEFDDNFVGTSRPRKEKPLIPNIDPREDRSIILFELITFLARLPHNKTTLIHNLNDGRAINLFKDKNGKLWYRWKGSGNKFTAYVSLRT